MKINIGTDGSDLEMQLNSNDTSSDSVAEENIENLQDDMYNVCITSQRIPITRLSF